MEIKEKLNQKTNIDYKSKIIELIKEQDFFKKYTPVEDINKEQERENAYE